MIKFLKILIDQFFIHVPDSSMPVIAQSQTSTLYFPDHHSKKLLILRLKKAIYLGVNFVNNFS